MSLTSHCRVRSSPLVFGLVLSGAVVMAGCDAGGVVDSDGAAQVASTVVPSGETVTSALVASQSPVFTTNAPATSLSPAAPPTAAPSTSTSKPDPTVASTTTTPPTTTTAPTASTAPTATTPLPTVSFIRGAPPQVYEFVIPAGTAARIASGENVDDVLPGSPVFRVGDSIQITNEDSQPHFYGPFALRSTETVRWRFPSPGVFPGQCTVSSDRIVTLTVVES